MPLMTSLHERLRAEADRDAEDAGAGDQRADLDADRGERHHHRDDCEGHEGEVAEDRQQRARRASRAAASSSRPAAPCAAASRRSMSVFRTCHRKIGDEEDHDGAEPAAHEPRHEGVAAGKLHDVDLPEAGEEQRRGEDQERRASRARHRRWQGSRSAPAPRPSASGGARRCEAERFMTEKATRQHERDDRDPEKPPRPSTHISQIRDEIDGEEPVERLALAMPGLARRSGARAAAGARAPRSR